MYWIDVRVNDFYRDDVVICSRRDVCIGRRKCANQDVSPLVVRCVLVCTNRTAIIRRRWYAFGEQQINDFRSAWLKRTRRRCRFECARGCKLCKRVRCARRRLAERAVVNYDGCVIFEGNDALQRGFFRN